MTRLPLHKAVDHLDELFFVVTAEGEMLQWNDRIVEVTGYSHKELAKMKIYQLVTADKINLFRRQIQKTVEKGKNRFEVPLQTQDGNLIPYEFSGSRVVHNSQALICGTGRDISARKQTEDELPQFEQQFQETLRHMPICAFAMDNNLCYTWVSASSNKRHPQNFLGKTDDDLFPEAEASRLMSLKREVIQSQKPVRAQTRVTLNGEKRCYDIYLTPQTINKQDKPTGLVGTALDITEQKKTEEALRQNKRKYQRLFEESHDGIVIHRYGQDKEVNPAGVTLLGYSQEEFKTLDLRSIYVDPQQRDKRLELLNQQGYVRDFESRFQRKDGQEIICLMTSSLWYDNTGHAEGRITIFRDITAEKQQEMALRESEEKFRTLAEESLVGIYLYQDGKQQYVNPCYAQIFGYSTDEITASDDPIKLLFHPDDLSVVRQYMNKRLSGGKKSIRYNFRGLTKDGQTVHLEAYGTRITYRDRPAVIGTLLDVTRQRRLQQDILHIQEEERQRIGQELHDGIASQLTGLTMMCEGLIHTLEEDGSIAAHELREITDLLHESAQQTRMLSRGLNPVRVGKKGLPAALEKLASITEKRSGIKCSFQFKGTLSDLSETITTHLYRIAQEAANNAVKHAEAQHISIRLTATKRNVILTLEDDGQGLSPEATETDGIGLQTMRYRADLIGGQLEINRSEEGGTCIRCILPTAAAEARPKE